MFSCTLCQKEYCYVSKFCIKCRRIKHLLNLYGDDVYNTLETVLVRNKTQQNSKIDNVYTKKLEKIQQIEKQKEKEQAQILEKPKIQWKENNVDYFFDKIKKNPKFLLKKNYLNFKKNIDSYNLENESKISEK